MARTKGNKPLDPVADFDQPVKRQEDLPGMENRALTDIESAARKYAAIRDKRIELNDAEVKLKDLLLGLLKKHDKREYKRDGIHVWIKVEEETVKVKITDEDEAPPSGKEGTDEPIRNNAQSRGQDRPDKRATGKSQGDRSQGEGTPRQAREEAGTAASEGDEEPADDSSPF